VRAAPGLALAVAAAGCHAHPAPLHGTAPDAGISIALYRQGDTAYGIVDDRRVIDIDTDRVLLANIDPGAALASLVIETGSADLRIGPCTRQRLPDTVAPTDDADRPEIHHENPPVTELRVPPPREPVITRTLRYAPVVECAAHGKRGRYPVRIIYVSDALAYRVQHQIALGDPATATIDSRFVLQTPPWHTSASVVVFDGIPGGARPPRDVAHGTLTLDGGTSVVLAPARDVHASVRYIVRQSGPGDAHAAAVWATLELPGITLAPGPIHLHVTLDGDDRWIATTTPDDDESDESAGESSPLRLPMWIDDRLRVERHRVAIEDTGDGTHLVELVDVKVTNTGSVPGDVLMFEHVRKSKHRRIENAHPTKPFTRGDTIITKLAVMPGRTARATYVLVTDD
jgi:hypothetical protein